MDVAGEGELSAAQIEWRVLPVADDTVVVTDAAVPPDRRVRLGPLHDRPAGAAAVGWSASARQGGLPGGCGVACCCRPNDVAQVLGQSACRAGGVLGQIEKVVQVSDKHFRRLYRPRSRRSLLPVAVSRRPVAGGRGPAGRRSCRFR